MLNGKGRVIGVICMVLNIVPNVDRTRLSADVWMWTLRAKSNRGDGRDGKG